MNRPGYDFNDSVDFGSESAPDVTTAKRPEFKTGRDYEPTVDRLVHEKCKSCGGTGQFRGYTGRVLGPCYKCKGQGEKMYKTSTEARARARERTADKKAADRAEFEEQFKTEIAWVQSQWRRQIERSARGGKVWDFPEKMGRALSEYGSWTDGQVTAIRNCMLRDQERVAERTSAAAATRAPCDPSKLTSAFARARAAAARDGEGVKFLKLRLGGLTISPDKESPVDVWFKSDDAWIGKTEGGNKFKPFRSCTPELEAQVMAICNDPAAAAVAHGMRTGQCSCCGRELTNRESIDLGIGPICRVKWGF